MQMQGEEKGIKSFQVFQPMGKMSQKTESRCFYITPAILDPYVFGAKFNQFEVSTL
jgi:hypothetical protein